MLFSRRKLDSFALNYKRLAFKTEWVEYPDIEALYHKLGFEATEKKPDGSPYYCLPVIHDPSTNTTLSDSLTIARYLDKTYPSTPILFPTSTTALQAGFIKGFAGTHASTYNIVVLPVWRILNERSQVYFRTTREARLHKGLEDVCTEESWQKAEKDWDDLAALFKLNGEGHEDLIMGDRLCYVDLQIVSVLIWARNCLGEDSDEWKRFCRWSGGKWKKYVDSFSEYDVADA